ncbi:MAG: hypothetical protein AAGC74_07925 [Verrucomicrobiota bacterium]
MHYITQQQKQLKQLTRKNKTMNDPIITYRGASAHLSELQNERVSQLEQQQGTRLIQYRGATAELNTNKTQAKKVRTISYRGATAEMEI